MRVHGTVIPCAISVMSRTRHAPKRSTTVHNPIQGVYQLGPAESTEQLPPRYGVSLSTNSNPAYLLCTSLNKLLVIEPDSRELYAAYERTDDMFTSVVESSGFIIVGSVLGLFYFVSLSELKCTHSIQVHQKGVIQTLVHPEEKHWLASIGEDSYLRLTNVSSERGKFKRVQDRSLLQLKISGDLKAMAFSPQGNWLLTGYDKGIRAWEVDRSALSKDQKYRKTRPPFSIQLTGAKFHQSAVERIVFMRDDIVASKDGKEDHILIWRFDVDADMWKMSSEMIEQNPPVLYKVVSDFSAFDFMPESCKLVIGNKGGVVRIIPILYEDGMGCEDDVTVRLGGIQDLPGPDQPITSVTCLSNKILVGLSNNCVALWN